jgi:hypothetical protein
MHQMGPRRVNFGVRDIFCGKVLTVEHVFWDEFVIARLHFEHSLRLATLRLFSFFPPLLSIPTARVHRYPLREIVMRTFHPFSPAHVPMPDAAQLDVQLQHPASKTSSPRPPSPPQSSLDILVNSPPPLSDQTANQNKRQISSVNNQQQPHPSTTNGVVNHSQPPVTAAPPSVLSNPDPNASLQSILAATRKDQIPPEVALHHWGIAPVPGPLPQHTTPHHAALIPQVSPITSA